MAGDPEGHQHHITIYEGEARRAARIADVSTYAVIFSAGLALAALSLIGQREQTRRRRVEAERLGQQRFRSLVQNASDIILIMGADRTIRYTTPAVESLLGYKPEEVVGKDNLTPVHPDDLARLEGTIAQALSNPGTSFYVELRLRHADGSWRHIESACTNLLDDPAVGGIVFNSRDVTERKKLEASLRHRASHDDLTGLPNRAFFAGGSDATPRTRRSR